MRDSMVSIVLFPCLNYSDPLSLSPGSTRRTLRGLACEMPWSGDRARERVSAMCSDDPL